MWIGDPTLTEKQSEKIKMLLDAVQRLSKLNKTLLLLSKIDNRQFPDVDKNDLKLVVEQILSYFEGQQENLQIELSTDLKENAFVRCNPILLNALLTNLIKNAFLHNVKEGHVDIKITSTSFEIKNSSDLSEIPKAKLYQRFSKQLVKKASWGLGLAIAKRICDSNGWD